MLRFLAPVAAALLCVDIVTALRLPRQVQPDVGITLKQAAGRRYFGAALGAGHLSNASDPKFAEFGAIQFSGSTPENEMKWDATEPNQNQFNFTAGDQIQQFAAKNHQRLRGHNLVWHNQLPAWVSTLNGTDLQDAMVNHIQKVMDHFKGKIFAWDVVNEAFNDNGDGSLGASPFLSQIGPGYIKLAFQTARQADPNARLYINEFNTEGINNKSNALFDLVTELKAENLIDGVGFQSHFALGGIPADMQQNLQRFADLGVEVAVTELDIRITNPATDADLQTQAQNYISVVKACTAVTSCVGITTWGITDLYSWIPGTFPTQGTALLFDDDYNKKPAFFSTIQAFLT